jgi:YD repeat-containing protein
MSDAMKRYETRFIYALAGLTAVIVIAATIYAHAGDQRTFYDEKGRVTGRAATQGNTTNFYNEKGQHTGTAVRRQDGSTQFYNSKGQSIGRNTR